ncbi:hypothetical protein CPC08DRAFT_57865 [Agrocybe pediades]|nr:hypothetical protein CPC08DRAFT_57865 [Agrocybe pediades]
MDHFRIRSRRRRSTQCRWRRIWSWKRHLRHRPRSRVSSLRDTAKRVLLTHSRSRFSPTSQPYGAIRSARSSICMSFCLLSCLFVQPRMLCTAATVSVARPASAPSHHRTCKRRGLDSYSCLLTSRFSLFFPGSDHEMASGHSSVAQLSLRGAVAVGRRSTCMKGGLPNDHDVKPHRLPHGL